MVKLFAFIKILIILLLIVVPTEAAKKRKKAKPKLFKNQWTLSSLHSYSAHSPLTDGINVGNQVFAVPRYEFINEVRPEVEIEYLNFVQLTVKPTLLLNITETHFDFPTETKSDSESVSDLKEFYAEFLTLKDWNVRFGLLTYQWGPAELFSPSNALFHFSKEAKAFSYLEKGYGLVDVIYNFSDSTNLQVLGEFIDNKEGTWIYQDKFNSRGLFKFEHSFENSLNYIGLSLGQMERSRSFLGLYANYVPFEGYSVYFDSRVTKGNLAYRPKALGAGRVDMQFADESDEQFGFYLVGIRFESDFDIRYENLQFSEGYDSNEYSLWLDSLSLAQPNIKNNLAASSRSGLEFLTRNYNYLSLRIPDIWWKNQMSLAIRGLHSVIGKSSLLTLSLETPLSDATVLSLEHMVNQGEANSEFMLSDKSRTSLGVKVVYF